MLQQTQVTTVIPYYQRFMARFPNISALADAPLDEVLHLWTGLGYYARARNLHKAAQQVRDKHHGVMPLCVEQLTALSGIGRSTACAITSLVDNQRTAILDGNVKRVLTRYAGVYGYPGIASVQLQLWQLADDLMQTERCGDYTQAMMDLGATLCRPSKPDCAQCPVAQECYANRHLVQHELPTKKPKKVRPYRFATFWVLLAGTSVLLTKRPSDGLWGGLFGFIEQAEGEPIPQQVVQLLSHENENLTELPSFVHKFSHFDLEIQPKVVKLAIFDQINKGTDLLSSYINEDQLDAKVGIQTGAGAGAEAGAGVAEPPIPSTPRSMWYCLNAPPSVGVAKPTLQIIEQIKYNSTLVSTKD